MYVRVHVCVCVCVCVCRCSPHWETSTLRGAWPTAWLLKGFLAGLCRSIYYLFPRVPASVSRICRGRGREREREGTPRRCLRLWRPAPTCSSSSCKARLLYSYVTCDDVTCDDVTCDDVTCDDVTCDSSTRSCCWRAHNLPRAYSLTWLLKVFGIFVCMCVWYVCVVCVCGMCVWYVCVVCVCGMCVWYVCVYTPGAPGVDGEFEALECHWSNWRQGQPDKRKVGHENEQIELKQIGQGTCNALATP